MGHDGVAAVDHAAVVAAFIEHAQVAAQHAGIIHVAVHGAFVGGNDHEVILVEADVRHMMQQALEHLVSRHDVVEAHRRHGVHDAGVMGVEGDDVLDADGPQLLQGERAVQALAADAPMLAAAVQAGHDDADAVGAAGDRLDQTHQVLEVVVGGKGGSHTRTAGRSHCSCPGTTKINRSSPRVEALTSPFASPD